MWQSGAQLQRTFPGSHLQSGCGWLLTFVGAFHQTIIDGKEEQYLQVDKCIMMVLMTVEEIAHSLFVLECALHRRR